MKATVLIPTFNHGILVREALRSVLAQTLQDFEVFIVGDGVSDADRGMLRDLAAADGRVHFFDHPKDSRHGEVYRHRALQEARGEIVAYLSDDDLWRPYHLQHLYDLLRDADFAHTLGVHVHPDGSLDVRAADLSVRETWQASVALRGIPLSNVAHTLAFYRTLPFGWRTTPKGIYTDKYMWDQCLAVPEVRAVTSARYSALGFPSPERREMALADRVAELQRWNAESSRPEFDTEINAKILQRLVSERVASLIEADTHRRACAALAERLARLETESAKLEAEATRAAESLRSDVQRCTAALDECEDERGRLRTQLDAIREGRWFKLRRMLLAIPGVARFTSDRCP